MGRVQLILKFGINNMYGMPDNVTPVIPIGRPCQSFGEQSGSPCPPGDEVRRPWKELDCRDVTACRLNARSCLEYEAQSVFCLRLLIGI